MSTVTVQTRWRFVVPWSILLQLCVCVASVAHYFITNPPNPAADILATAIIPCIQAVLSILALIDHFTSISSHRATLHHLGRVGTDTADEKDDANRSGSHLDSNRVSASVEYGTPRNHNHSHHSRVSYHYPTNLHAFHRPYHPINLIPKHTPTDPAGVTPIQWIYIAVTVALVHASAMFYSLSMHAINAVCEYPDLAVGASRSCRVGIETAVRSGTVLAAQLITLLTMGEFIITLHKNTMQPIHTFSSASSWATKRRGKVQPVT